MRWRLALVLALLFAPPLVEASHVHDHRYMVVGRVLDGSGLPAGLVTVRGELLDAPGFVSAQVAQTNCLGDFVLVFAVGELDLARARLTVNQNTTEHALDPVTRRTFAKLDTGGTFAPRPCRDARANFTLRHVVTGRLVDGDAQPRPDVDLDVTLELAAGGTLVGGGDTNAAGDYAIAFQSDRLPAGGTAVVSDGERAWRAPLDVRYGITVADHRAGGGPNVVAVLAGLLALGAAGVLAYAYFGRQRSDR